jgi:hypothetical protein
VQRVCSGFASCCANNKPHIHVYLPSALSNLLLQAGSSKEKMFNIWFNTFFIVDGKMVAEKKTIDKVGGSLVLRRANATLL